MKRLLAPLALLVTAISILPVVAQDKGADLPFVNWENPPVHPLDLSPDRTTLALANTPDNRLEIFDVTTGVPKLKASIPVGVEPVSVRFRNNTEVWVVNHISDSVSIVDLATGNVTATLLTDDEPYDLVFAGSPLRAFVSCSQANTVLRFNPANLSAAPARIAIGGEDPRALAVSPDGQFVYAAIFESGNGTTILGGGIDASRGAIAFPPNVVGNPAGPHAGVNPPPNEGAAFEPPIAPVILPPGVGLIVRQDDQGRWVDDNGGDWTALVSGPQAGLSGRPVGWELLDRDIAIIDTQDLSVSYANRLMNMVMALSVNPATADVHAIGTDATNHIRFEPNLTGRFIRVNMARVNADGSKGAVPIADLNPHLDYETGNIPQATRDLSVGDPRGMVWNSAGTMAWISGMGSNNVIALDPDGARIGAPLEVGQGPTGLALDELRDRLYVWNRFSGDISVVDTVAVAELLRVPVFNPTPEVIRTGRRHFYGTHETSGLGHIACASCHVDGRMDRLAWDLGDPSGAIKQFNQNCQTDIEILGFEVENCADFHPMKGPMMTQTFQDIIGHEPFHWRGDRDGLEEFNAAFVGLQGDDAPLTPAQMQQYEDFVATITFPPNPFRNLDNSLPTDLPLPGHFFVGADGRTPGEPLPNGNAVNGLDLYLADFRDDPFQCASCHTLPTGMSANSPLLIQGIPLGGAIMPQGPNGENHLGIVSVDGSTNRHFKTPHLRNLYEKVGFDLTQQQNRSGFGFLHDGSVDSLVRFVTEPAFEPQTGQDVADLVAFLLSFAGSDLPTDNPDILVPGPDSQDTHAAVGVQTTVDDETVSKGFGHKGLAVSDMLDLAASGAVDLVAKGVRDGESRGWVYNRDTDRFDSDRLAESLTPGQLTGPAVPGEEITFTVVPAGLGVRLGIDRDFDGVFDQDEKDQGSDPDDPDSTKFRPAVGMWFNFDRPGHGMDLQLQGDVLFATWFTYNPDGSNTWYLAVAAFDFESMLWVGEMRSFRWPGPTSEVVGTLTLTFSDPETAKFEWDIDGETGSEIFNYFVGAADPFTPANFTGHWYVPLESGYGFTVNMQGGVEFTLLYYYDGTGNPRWVLGSNESGAQVNTLEMLSFTGFCPNCPTVDTTNVSAGSMTHDFSVLNPTEGIITTEITYPGAEGGTWNRADVVIEPLSDPVD